MPITIAINGFGRIGRLLARIALESRKLRLVAVNDLADAQALAMLFRYDSVHPAFPGTVQAEGNGLLIDGKRIIVLQEKDPAKLPWKKLGVDIVAECTGLLTKGNSARVHLGAGARTVIVSAPCSCEGGACPPDMVKTIVLGVNERTYQPRKHRVISNASCTTNCAAPVLKVIHDAFGIVRGTLTTVHAYTADQRLQDASHRDLRRARAAAQNIIPTGTGAALSVAEVIPELAGKLDALALRVPVINGSVTDFTLQLKKKATAQQVNAVMRQAAAKGMKGIIRYNEDPIVSSDIITDPHSAIFDAPFTKALDGSWVKALAWYDNEWGFSCRMAELMEYIGSRW